MFFNKRVFFRAENTGIFMLFEVWGGRLLRSGGTPRGLRGPSSAKVGKSLSFDPPPGAPEVPFWEPFRAFSLLFPVCFFLVFLEGPWAFGYPRGSKREPDSL